MARSLKKLHFPTSLDFSYNITRSYPYRRLKWIIVVLMSLILIGFSVFNLATVGYDLQPRSSLNANETESRRWWFNNKLFTWGDDKLNPKCNNLNVDIGDQFLTSNLGAKWTLNSIIGANGSYPSLAYHGQLLENCSVNIVTIDMKKVDNSAPGPDSQWWTWASSTANIGAQCNIINDQGLFTIFFSSHYNGASEVFDYLAVNDYNKSTSLWWGARLMDNYFTGMKAMLARGADNQSSNPIAWSSGSLMFVHNNSDESNNIHGLSLLRLDSYFFFGQDSGVLNSDTDQLPNKNGYFNNGSFLLGRAMTEGLFFAKVLYSEALVDLGVNLTRSANLLLDEQSLQYALRPTDDLNRQPGQPLNGKQPFDWYKVNAIKPPGLSASTPANATNTVLMSEVYNDTTHFPRLPLGTKPAVIYSQYTCSIPTAKGTSTIVMQVIIADFVVLQVAWTILTWLADKYVSAKDDTAMWCEGCKQLHEKGEELAVLAMKGVQLSTSAASVSPTLSSSSVPLGESGQPMGSLDPKKAYQRVEDDDPEG